MVTIGEHGLGHAVVLEAAQYLGQHLFQRRPDQIANVQAVRPMPQRAQRRAATRQDTGLRVDDGAVQIEQYSEGRSGHASA